MKIFKNARSNDAKCCSGNGWLVHTNNYVSPISGQPAYAYPEQVSVLTVNVRVNCTKHLWSTTEGYYSQEKFISVGFDAISLVRPRCIWEEEFSVALAGHSWWCDVLIICWIMQLQWWEISECWVCTAVDVRDGPGCMGPTYVGFTAWTCLLTRRGSGVRFLHLVCISWSVLLPPGHRVSDKFRLFLSRIIVLLLHVCSKSQLSWFATLGCIQVRSSKWMYKGLVINW